MRALLLCRIKYINHSNNNIIQTLEMKNNYTKFSQICNTIESLEKFNPHSVLRYKTF